MTEPGDLRDEVSRMRDKITDLEVSSTRKLGEIETKVSTAKHDIVNIQQMFVGMNSRIDRFETQIKADLKEVGLTLGRELQDLGRQLAEDVGKLSREITTDKVSSAKGAGFYAGVLAAVTAGGGILMFLGKVLFGGSH